MQISKQRVEILLAERRWSMRALSEACGMPVAQISDILRRESCTPRTAGALASGLGVPVQEIIAAE